MSATIDGRISFDCPSCAAHLQVPARLAGVTGPCPKCGATIVAPRQSVAPEHSGGSTASHHEDPSSGRKKGYTSLRRRRARVDAPPKDLQGITSRAKGHDDAESVSTPFSQFAADAEREPVETERKPEPKDAAEKKPVAESEMEPESEGLPNSPEVSSGPAASEEVPNESKTTEESGPKKFSSMPSFLSGGFAGMAFPGAASKQDSAAERSTTDPTNLSMGEGEKSKPAVKRPIDLRRDRGAPEPRPPAEEAVEEEKAPPLDLEADRAEAEEKPPVLAEEIESEPGVPATAESREDAGDDGAWPWMRKESEEVEPDPSEVEAKAAVDTEEVPPTAETGHETPPAGDFEWLLSDDAEIPPAMDQSRDREENEVPSARNEPEPMFDLEKDLDEVIGRRDDADGETPPPAPGPFPKWSSLEGSGLAGLTGAPRTADSSPPLATSQFPRDEEGESQARESSAAPPLDVDPWKKPEISSESPKMEEAAPPLEDPWKKAEPTPETSGESEPASSPEAATAPPLDDPWAPPKLSVETPDDTPPPLAEDKSEASDGEEPEHAIPVTLRPSRLRESDAQGAFGGPRSEPGSGLSLRLSEEGEPERVADEDDNKKPSGKEATAEQAPAAPWKPSRDLSLRADDSNAPSEAPASSAAPWLSPQSMAVAKQAAGEAPVAEASSPSPAIEKEPSEPEETPAASEKGEDLPERPSASDSLPPIAKLPRFLDDSPAQTGVETVLPTQESRPPVGSGGAESVSAEEFAAADEMPPLPAASGKGSPPMLDMQAFGEGEPPRPGDRATAPGQQIRLPQIFDGGSDEKAVVSPITGEQLPSFAPLDEEASGQSEVSEKGRETPAEESDTDEPRDWSPPAAAWEPVAEKPDRLPSLKDFRIGDPDEEKKEETVNESPELAGTGDDSVPEPENTEPSQESKSDDPGNFISERVKAATNSLSLRGDAEQGESVDDAGMVGAGSSSSELPPPVTPEIVSVPSSGHQDGGDGKTKSTLLDVETEEEEREGGPEDEGLAKVLGLLPRGKSAPARSEQEAPKPESESAPSPEQKKDSSTKDGGPALPSIDDVLAGKGRPQHSGSDKGSWVEGIKSGLQTLDGRQKTILIGGAAAAVLAVLIGIVGLAAGWFSGDSSQADPAEAPPRPVAGNDTGAVPEPPAALGGKSADENGTKPEESLPPSPAPAGGGNKLVIVDPGAANATPKASGSEPSGTGPGSVAANPAGPEQVTSEEPGSRKMTSLIPGGEGNFDEPADVAIAVAWASGPPEEKKPGKPEPADSIGAPEPVDAPDALVMPTVGAVGAVGAGTEVGPLVSDGTGSVGNDGSHFNYEEIAGVGEDGKAPTGAPVIPETTTDPEVAMDRQEDRVQSVAPIESAGDSAAAASESPKKTNLDDPLEASKFALQQFLAQPTWQKRLPFIYEADRLKPRIEAYYQTAKDGPITESVSKFFDMDENPADGGDPFYAFYLFLEGIETEFPVVVRKSADGYKVDWELFVECKDRLFLDFKNSEQSGPATFRFVMQRHSYWGPDRETFANSNDYICYKVEPPYPGAEAFVFVAKDSAVAAQTEKIATWGLPPVDVVLTLERVEFPHGVKHFVIKSLDKLSWVAP